MRSRAPLTALSVALAAALLAPACAQGKQGAGGFVGDDAGADAAPPVIDATLPQPTDASSILDSGCATATAPIQRDPIYMLMVVDGSASMREDNKWDATVPSLAQFIDALASLKDKSFGLGLTVFSDSKDKTNGVGPYDTMDVPIAYVDDAQAQKLHARFEGAVPTQQTPTLAVLTGQYPLVEQFTPQAPLLPNGKRVLVIMTDGVPYPDPAGTEKDKCVGLATYEYAKRPPSGPVMTFAIGIGYTEPYDPQIYDPKFMAQLALAGGAPNEPCNPDETRYEQNMCHFQLTPVGTSSATTELELEMLVAFDKIRAKVTSCDLTLDQTGLVDPSRVNVVFTDANAVQDIVPEDAADGWTYDDPKSPTKVILHGQACDALKANPSGNVQVVLGCKTIVK